jgi:hypothetical protein
MVGLLVAMFAGLVVLMHLDGIGPRSDQSALSQLGITASGPGRCMHSCRPISGHEGQQPRDANGVLAASRST